MCPAVGLVEAELRSSGNDFHLVCDVVSKRLCQVQGSRHTINERQGVHAKRSLERCHLKELVQHHIGVGVSL